MKGEQDRNEGGSAAKLPPSLIDKVAVAIDELSPARPAPGSFSYERHRKIAGAAIAVMIDDLRALRAQVDTEYAGYVLAIIHRWERE